MAKPVLDPYKPPMSLMESEALLREEERERNSWSELVFSGWVLGLLALGVLSVMGIVYLVLLVIRAWF